ncbi:MAG: hypothetical protein KGY53_12875, partial [Wenzhouxiangellaceae bacterium]|nr:hypothetical protein [Wenzhouxiangellaceae bacterium]
MISSMKRLTRSLLAAILIGLSTAVHVTPLLLVAVVKMIFRTGTVRRWCDRWLMRIAENWIGFNSWMIDHLTDTRIEVEGMPDSSR